MNPKISIIVPVYNTALYLEQCLDSIIGQNFCDIEIILIDDGSTDGSDKICEKYSQIDKRIIFYRQNHRGPSQARNTGIIIASGDYSMFVDSDDWLEHTCCESLYSAVKSTNSDFVIASHVNESSAESKKRYIFSENKLFKGKEYREQMFLPILGESSSAIQNPSKIDKLTPVWSRLYSTKIIKLNNLKFVDLDLVPSECLQFNLDYCSKAKSAYYIKDIVYHYRRNTTMSVTKPYRNDLLDKWIFWISYLKKNYEEELSKPDFAISFKHRICYSIIPLGGNSLKLKKRKLIRKDVSSFLSNDYIQDALKELNYSNCSFHWRLFFKSAKKQKIRTFIFLTRAMRMYLKWRKN